ncbi:metal ABC transporter permease [Thiobacillus sp. 65-1402]|mgnify:FL=1|uniref:metal ABC transporter permease n=1 Tax=Thiobacillus sp. 65-1402 TaxID=1895861 RepID=UPI0009681209|nr:metal ABC transporter permease [Thiobacillus sp. 65-1402]OJW92479.1 MAG: zinc/manganese transporter permease [Thiobacillus sp. 65-1402]
MNSTLNLAALDPGLLGWPLLAGLLVLATHVPLGRRVLARGVIFLDLAIAQIAVLGVIAAHALDLAPDGWPTQLAAAAAALAGAALLAGCERRWPAVQEALIGSAFVVAASLGALLLAGDPHGGEHLSELLTGQILWATPRQAAQIGVLYAALLALWAWRGTGLGTLGFYLVFALAITASVQLVGVYLVFASLILPALAVRGWPPRTGLLAGWALGALAYAAGLAASALFDWPAGPAIVIALAIAALLGGSLLRVAARGRQR